MGLVHYDPCECKVKGFRVVSSIERNVSKERTCKGCDTISTGELRLWFGHVAQYEAVVRLQLLPHNIFENLVIPGRPCVSLEIGYLYSK